LNNSSGRGKGRILAIDFGMARLGLALSDDNQIIASPVSVITAEKKSEATVQKLIAEIQALQTKNRCQIVEIVVGLPLMMSGKAGFLSDEVRHFVDLLQKATPIPIITWDERLSSVQAERAMREANMNRRKRSKVVDIVAAVIILQSYLDSK
jgi:putative Holliday junction resolvase